MSEHYNTLDWISLVLVIIGGINWGLVGFFGYDLVAAIFGSFSAITRIIYALVGLGALYMVATGAKMSKQDRYLYGDTTRTGATPQAM